MSTIKVCLRDDAGDRRLEEAAMGNHRELFLMNAEALGGEIRVDGNVFYTYDGKGRQAMAGLAGEAGGGLEEMRLRLDRMMSFFRDNVPRGIGWWSLEPAMPEGIGALLLARGFQPGWKPCWMVRDLQIGHTAAYARPQDLRIEADNEANAQEVKHLPYSGDDGAVSRALMKARPDVVRQFIARWQGRIVGHCCVALSEGVNGVAGLYNVAVVPEARERGIGKALVTEACDWAREKGWRYAVLNGTGRRMYEQTGFRWIGDGATWWVVNAAVFGEAAPGPGEIALAEAVGLGDIASLERLADIDAEAAPVWIEGLLGPDALDRPLANRLSLLQLAIQCGQPESAAWLVAHGASCSVLEAWDLGWKEQAAARLAAEPGLVNMLYGDGQTTLLHIAADRNDLALARLALSAGPDLSIRDKFYGNTALGWAKFFKRKEMVGLIRGKG